MSKKESVIEAQYLLKILDSIDDYIYIADKHGKTLWASEKGVKEFAAYGVEIEGKNVGELEKSGLFNPSAIKKAIETGKNVTTVQTLVNGQKYMVTGHLIHNEAGDVAYVVAHARNLGKVTTNTPQLELDEINSLLQHYLMEIRKINIQQLSKQNGEAFIGQGLAYRNLVEMIDTVAGVETTVLIMGETGVGKNAVAGHIHRLSERHEKPIIHVNCAAIPETLIESELFGYQKGAFTGANTTGKIGLVKLAEGGTLFLDEISELPLHLQAKLLQLLQNKTYLPIGATQTVKADVRIIVATNRDLEQMVNEGRFRADLYYRLNILPINIPPLRERRDDIFPLLNFYLALFTERHKRKRSFSREAIDLLQNYSWPGNVRELENLVEQVVIITKKEEISIDDLPERFQATHQEEQIFDSMGESLPEIMAHVERKVIEQAYRKHKTTRKTATALGITQSLLMRRLQHYEIEKE
ncbi:UNVERIFIED_CONTAM: TyrR family helix-turn-helix protein [Brevibacillus sp. OAP136]